MAWFDIAGGVAGGLQKGLEEFEQAQRQKQQDQEKAQRDFLAAVQGGLVDPLNVTEETLQGLSPQQMKALFVKDPSGKLMLRMEPGRMGELTRQRSAKDVFYGDTFGTLPVEQQLRIAAESGINPEETLLRMSPEARSTYQRIKRPPTISEYQDRVSDIDNIGAKLLERRKELGASQRTADKELRAQIDAQLAQLREQRATLNAALDQLYGLPAPAAMTLENPFPTEETPEEPESDWLATAGQLALGAASLYGGGKALQLGGRYLLPRLAPALAARMGIGTPAAATTAAQAAARRANIRSKIFEEPTRRGSSFKQPPRRPSSGGPGTPPPPVTPPPGGPAAAERDVAASMAADILRTPARPATRAVNLRPDVVPSTAAAMPRAAQQNVAPLAQPVAPGPAQVFGPQGPPAPPAVTEQGQQYILDSIESIRRMKDPEKAAAALDELQELLQQFLGVAGKNPFRP